MTEMVDEPVHLEPCPFCGKKPNLEDPDTLYPTGIYWIFNEQIGLVTYHSAQERTEDMQPCYTMHCPTAACGCGAEICADSRDEAIEAWNRRASVPKSELTVLQALEDALELARNGLQWYMDTFYDVVRDCDYEAMQQIDKALLLSQSGLRPK